MLGSEGLARGCLGALGFFSTHPTEGFPCPKIHPQPHFLASGAAGRGSTAAPPRHREGRQP